MSVAEVSTCPVAACIEKVPGKSAEKLTQAAGLSETELLARLVFAEGLSAGLDKREDCSARKAEIFEGIAWGVLNRVRLGNKNRTLSAKYGAGLRGVIFKPGQFNPAISEKSEFAPYFLCPSYSRTGLQDWCTAYAAAQAALSGREANPFLQTPDENKYGRSRVVQFYYPLSSQATKKPPAWADTSKKSTTWVRDLTIRGQKIPDRCIWFFRSEPYSEGDRMSRKTEIATLAGGCFWGVEELLRTTPGVLETTVGYTGGILPGPTYEKVKKGDTGHAEAVQIEFDPSVVSYEKLLLFFFKLHDPTTTNRQGNDIGSQYRSAIFYADEEQKKVATAVKERVDKSGKWKRPVVTEIVPAVPFYPAEGYHQKYLEKNPGGYTCHYVRDYDF